MRIGTLARPILMDLEYECIWKRKIMPISTRFPLLQMDKFIFMDNIWIQRIASLPRRYKRIKVKGHYRLVLRSPDGTFDKVRKWSSKKRKRKR